MNSAQEFIPPMVSVFGGSKPKPYESAYQDALKLGHSLGSLGYTVMTGGYIGTMEAVSRGVSDAGGHVIGVTCDEIEAWRPVGPNPWVKEELRFPTLKMRLYALIENCDIAIALPGGIGTLQEIVVMWSQIQVGIITPRFIILVGRDWENVFQSFFIHFDDYIPRKDKRWLHFTSGIDPAVAHLLRLMPPS
jgi:uncharacterized protein (TIGR00730 family)